MQTIRFAVDHIVPDGSGTEYSAGQVVRLSSASAQHFLKRSLAVEVKDEAPTVADLVDVARGDGGIAGDGAKPEQRAGSNSPATPTKRPYHRRK